jgi:hypothetical protein
MLQPKQIEVHKIVVREYSFIEPWNIFTVHSSSFLGSREILHFASPSLHTSQFGSHFPPVISSPAHVSGR